MKIPKDEEEIGYDVEAVPLNECGFSTKVSVLCAIRYLVTLSTSLFQAALRDYKAFQAMSGDFPGKKSMYNFIRSVPIPLFHCQPQKKIVPSSL